MAKNTVWFAPKVVNNKRYYVLKYVLLAYLVLVLIFEALWTFYIVNKFHEDLQTYEWDAIWIKEFYKSTKNFFIFTVILIVLAGLLGLAATYTENRTLLLVFIMLLIAEWGFELIGVYASKDRNVVIYKMVPATLRPGLIVISYLFYSKMRAMGTSESSVAQNGPS